jgi:hypothetical protein
MSYRISFSKSMNKLNLEGVPWEIVAIVKKGCGYPMAPPSSLNIDNFQTVGFHHNHISSQGLSKHHLGFSCEV